MADGRHVGKYSKCYNSLTNGPTMTQLGCSHPITFPTCPPWCGCHGNGCCLLTAHWTFCSYGSLEAERVNQFWWNLVHNSKLGSQWQPRDQIVKFLKFKMADGRHVGKYLKCHNSPTNGPTVTQLGCSHPITFPTCPPWCGCRGNGRCLPTAHWTFCRYGRLEAERVNQFRWNMKHNSMLGPQWQSRDQILNVKIQNGGRSLLESIRNVITRLQMDRLGRNLGGRIPSCSQYWKCYNSAYDGTDWYDSWVVASMQHLCCKTVSLVYGRYCYPHSERSGFTGCLDQKHPQFWWNLDDCATAVQKIYKIW